MHRALHRRPIKHRRKQLGTSFANMLSRSDLFAESFRIFDSTASIGLGLPEFAIDVLKMSERVISESLMDSHPALFESSSIDNTRLQRIAIDQSISSSSSSTKRFHRWHCIWRRRYRSLNIGAGIIARYCRASKNFGARALGITRQCSLSLSLLLLLFIILVIVVIIVLIIDEDVSLLALFDGGVIDH